MNPKKKLATLSQFHSIRPRNIVSQEDSTLWMAKAHVEAKDGSHTGLRVSQPDRDKMMRRFLRYGVKSDKIATRAFECPDIGSSSSDHSPQNKKRTLAL